MYYSYMPLCERLHICARVQDAPRRLRTGVIKFDTLFEHADRGQVAFAPVKK